MMLYYLFCQEHRGLLSIRYPMEHGIVRDWNDMERIWQYIFSKDQLQTFPEEVFVDSVDVLIYYDFWCQAYFWLSVPEMVLAFSMKALQLFHSRT